MPKDLQKKDTKQGWTHADQSPNMSGKLLCYQSIVALTTNQERTLVVYEGSNTLYQKYCLERQLKGTKHWQKIDYSKVPQTDLSKLMPEIEKII